MLIYFLPIIIIVIDQLSKLYVLNNIPLNTYIEVFSDILIFQHIQNDGIAFGISLGNFQGIVLAITLIIIGVVVYLLSLSIKNNSTDKYPLAFIVGGAIGNAIDRILVYFLDSYNGVVDFIYVGFNENGESYRQKNNIIEMYIDVLISHIHYRINFIKKTKTFQSQNFFKHCWTNSHKSVNKRY